ncbi:MAG: hypothetical protein C4309_10795 [Chloroflexota bacterium]
MGSTVQRVSVVFPSELWEKVKALVPPGQRSRLIVEATRHELHRLELLAALDESAGAWSEENHPGLETMEAIHRWLDEQRATYFPQRETGE